MPAITKKQDRLDMTEKLRETVSRVSGWTFEAEDEYDREIMWRINGPHGVSIYGSFDATDKYDGFFAHWVISNQTEGEQWRFVKDLFGYDSVNNFHGCKATLYSPSWDLFQLILEKTMRDISANNGGLRKDTESA